MTREEAKRILYVYRAVNLVDASHREAFDMAITELEHKPCDDAISRAEVLSHAKKDMGNGHEQPFDYVEVDIIKQLPPVTPQYTEAEIQKMQDLESAEIQTAYEIGKAEGSEVLDKIRAEIDSYCSDNRDRNDGLYIAMRIIDKYKASPTGEEVEE